MGERVQVTSTAALERQGQGVSYNGFSRLWKDAIGGEEAEFLRGGPRGDRSPEEAPSLPPKAKPKGRFQVS